MRTRAHGALLDTTPFTQWRVVSRLSMKAP